MDLPELFNTIKNLLKHNHQLKYQKYYWGDDMCSFTARKKVKGWIEIWLLEDHIEFSNVFTPNKYGKYAIELYTETIKTKLHSLEDFYNAMQELITQESYILEKFMETKPNEIN
jgi:hypothetical protein